ncbi:DUF305 domain-containing protein [Micromonospora sp. WMMA1363]|uniref:DUF305 domain-containing protein n=1 Tax=Micromonospora sp. WMMA1363 TaxID=3053985 RepID=UPI00259CF872|nr:DUF305 domain-containing protein [Micromonospora sp. WMMA1363]MDM4722350.1 DUF305 domain-containing protein [Micromonospora sp. WMMA1363]
MRRLPLIALLAVAALMAGCARTPEQDAPGPSATDEVPVATSTNGADVLFLRMMAVHTGQTLEIIRSGRDRVADPEIKTLVAAIEATESDELAMTQAWLQATGPDAGAAEHGEHAGHAVSDEELARLRGATDAAVDTVVCDVLGTHQRSAADLARAHLKAGTSPEVLAYARRVEQSRSAEAALLDTLSTADR